MPEKMRLYHSPTTPFGRKVVVLLMETGQEADVEVVEVAGTPLAPGSLPLDRNPLGKIPALDRADGGALYDSRVICRYLDERAGTGLYPKGEALWPTLTLEATADGMMDAGVLMAYEMRIRPEDKRFADWTEAQWGKIARALDHLEANRLPQLAGPLDMGQIALACALGYLDFRHDARGWRNGRPGLAKWFEAISRRPSLMATVPQA